MDQIDYRFVQPNESGLVVALHRAVFPDSCWGRTIYAADGVERYLANLVAFPQWQDEHVLMGAWAGKHLIGYAHFRALPQFWHLNNVAVSSAYQRIGIGRALFRRWVELGRQRGYKQLSLDVASTDERAVAWYRRRGLRTTEQRWVYEKSLDKVPFLLESRDNVQLRDWENAEAWQATYGFSQFLLIFEGGTWSVGRLGDRYFRVTRPLPRLLESILAEIDPRRRLLIFSDQPIETPGFVEVLMSLRMQCDIKNVSM